MDSKALVAAIDEEISRLEQVKGLLAGVGGVSKRLGKQPATAFPHGANTPKKRPRMSADGRARIAAAQKKRWAKQKAASK